MRSKMFMVIFTVFAILLPYGGATATARHSYRDSLAALRSKNYSLALSHIRRAVQLAPENERYRYWYGYILYRQQQYNAALQQLRRSGKYLPNSSLYYRARSNEALKRYRRALQLLEQGLQLPETRPGYRHYYYLRAIRIVTDHYGEQTVKRIIRSADRYYKQEKKNKPYYVNFRAAKWYLLQARRAVGAGRCNEGRRFYSSFLGRLHLPLGNYRRYLRSVCYAEALRKKKRYRQAAAALEKLPADWHTPGVQALKLRLAAELTCGSGASRKKGVQKGTQKIIRQMKQLVTQYREELDRWSWYMVVGTYVTVGAHRELIGLEQMLRNRWRKDNKRFPLYLHYRICKAHEKLLYTIAAKGADREMVRILNRLLQRIAQPMGRYANRFKRDRLLFMRRVLQYRINNPVAGRRVYRHKMLVTVIADSDLCYTGYDGVQRIVKDHIPENKLQQYRSAFALLRRYYYYYTRGAVEIICRFDYRKAVLRGVKRNRWEAKYTTRTGAPVRHLKYFSPQLGRIEPDHTGYFFQHRNNFDTFVVVFPSKGITRVSTGSRGALEFFPFTLYSRVKRGRINLAGSNLGARSHRLLIHEFFHTVESAYRKQYPYHAHVWRKQYRRWWPTWYNGEDELLFYEQVFARYLRPAGSRPLAYRSRPSTLSSQQLQRLRVLTERYTLKQLQEADRLQRIGRERFFRKKYREAFALYKRSYQLNPYRLAVCRRLAYLYYKVAGDRIRMKQLFHRAATLPGAGTEDRRRAARYRR